jgi:alcohol dehydrogenase class IV
MTASPHFLCRAKTAFGTHALFHLPFDLSSMNACKPFVITDQAARDAELHRYLARAFRESDMALGIATLTDTRDHLHEIETLHRLFVEKGYDSIMALGTGSVVQMAKILNLTVCLGPEVLRSCAGPQQINSPLLPLVFIPTLPSDGRETTTKTEFEGRSFVSGFLMPDLVIITADTMLGAPEKMVLDAGLTSLAICCEAFVVSNSPLIRSYAATAIRLVMDTLVPLAQNPGHDDLLCQKARKNRRDPLAGLTHAAALSGFIRSNCQDLKTWLTNGSSGPDRILALVHLFETSQVTPAWLGKLLLPLTDPEQYTAVPGSRRPDLAIQTIRELINSLSRIASKEIPNGDA